MTTYVCPVCGYGGLTRAPYYPDQWGNPSDEICPSCGTQFGYDDASLGTQYDMAKRAARHEQLRAKWIAGGMRWWRSEIYWWNVNVRFAGKPPLAWEGEDDPPPEGWDPIAQLRRLAQEGAQPPDTDDEG